MAYKVIYKKRFYNRLSKLLFYLEKEWSKQVADEFLSMLDKRIATLQKQPYIGNPSQKVKDVRGILITKHNKLFYKVSGQSIVVLTMYDTRMNPKGNRYL